jgi:hypothetical protein
MPVRLPLPVTPRRLLLSLALLAVCALPAAAIPMVGIANEVSLTSYTSILQTSLYAHNGDNRGFGTQHDLARQSIFDQLSAFGLVTSLDPFTYGASTCYNVMAVQQGLINPDRIWVIGAHYDSVNNPGADDNASGVAGLIEAARVLSAHSFGDTIMYVAFDREEQGLVGSHAFANERAAWDFAGMVGLDMIAYNPAGSHYNTVSLYGGRRNWNVPFRTALGAAIDLYSPELDWVDRGGIGASDHQSFEDLDIDSALMIEDGFSANPYYHKATDSLDTPGYIDYLYASRVTRAAVGFLAESAGRGPEPATAVLFALGLLALRLRSTRRAA